MTHPRPTQAVILAGGRGTRLRPLTEQRPKSMVSFHGRPFLEYLVEQVREQGIERILILLAWQPQVVIDHFGSGAGFGVQIAYDVTPSDGFTASSYRLRHAAPQIDDVFLLLYCDNYWPLQLDRLWAGWRASGTPAQITVYDNPDNASRDNVIVGADGFVEMIDRSRSHPGLKGIEIGYAILAKAAILSLLTRCDQPFEQAVYPALIARRQLRAYRSLHRYYSIGSFDRLERTAAFLARRPAVIVARDGLLDQRSGWVPGALAALDLFAKAGGRVIVVADGVGVKAMTSEIEERRMHAAVAAAGATIDASYRPIHEPDGDPREPVAEMLFRAQREFDLDLTRTPFVGTRPAHAAAAAAAGCPFWPLEAGTPLVVDRRSAGRSFAFSNFLGRTGMSE